MSKGRIVLERKTWRAIVAYFRDEERNLREGFGVPGNRDNWREEYKKETPDGWKSYDRARRAIDEIEGKAGQRS